MSLWPVLVLAVSSNLDDLGVGFSLGLKGRKPPLLIVSIIASISGLTMLLGMLLGHGVADLMSPRVASILSAVVFAGVAIWFILDDDDDDDEQEEVNQVTRASEQSILSLLKQGVVLGIALGVDSVVIGFSGGLAGYSLLFTSVAAALTSWGLIFVGSRLGYIASKKAGKYGPYLAAALLFSLALKELIAGAG